MTRNAVTAKILAKKRDQGVSWKTIVAEIGGGSAVYLTAALLGQMRLRPEQAERAAKLFGLDADEQLLLQEIPYRGSSPGGDPDRPADLSLLRACAGLWHDLEDADRGGIRRWHHECDRFRDGDRAAARPEGRPRQADLERQVSALPRISTRSRPTPSAQTRSKVARFRCRNSEGAGGWRSACSTGRSSPTCSAPPRCARHSASRRFWRAAPRSRRRSPAPRRGSASSRRKRRRRRSQRPRPKSAENPQTLDLARLKADTENVGYPILPLVRQLAEKAGEAGRWLHWGATTQDIMDTAVVLQIRAGLALHRSGSRGGARPARRSRAPLPRHADGRPHPSAARAADHLWLQGRGVALGPRPPRRAACATAPARARRPVRRCRRHARLARRRATTPSEAAPNSRANSALGDPPITWHVARDGIAETVQVLALLGRQPRQDRL